MSDKVFGEGADELGLKIIKEAIAEPEFWERVEDSVITCTKVLYEMVLANPFFIEFENLTEEQYEEVVRETGASQQAMTYSHTMRGIVGQLVSATYAARTMAVKLKLDEAENIKASNNNELH